MAGGTGVLFEEEEEEEEERALVANNSTVVCLGLRTAHWKIRGSGK